MTDFLRTSDLGRAVAFDTLRDNLPNNLATLGIAANDPAVVQQRADSIYWRALLGLQTTAQGFGVACTSWKVYERDGGPVAVPMPAMPTLPANFPQAVPPGILVRYRLLVKMIKACPNYTTALGQALGIETSQQTGPDPDTLLPVFTLGTNIGEGIMVNWTWQGYSQFLDACEIRVDRNDGKGEILLCQDTTPGYLDTQPRPATPTKWTYRIAFLVGDQRFGQWSSPVSITVGG